MRLQFYKQLHESLMYRNSYLHMFKMRYLIYIKLVLVSHPYSSELAFVKYFFIVSAPFSFYLLSKKVSFSEMAYS